MRIAVVAVAIALASPAWAQELPAGFSLSVAQRVEGEALVGQAGQALLDGLNDPGSARYRQVFIRTTLGTDGQPHLGICGQVNAKNAMGGYSGWEEFAYMPGAIGLILGRSSFISAATVCNPQRGHWDARDYAPELAEAAKLD